MGRINSINTGFWTSPQVVDNFTPEERYVYLYCLTNPRTNLCGCYEVSIKTIAFETGLERYEVRDILASATMPTPGNCSSSIGSGITGTTLRSGQRTPSEVSDESKAAGFG